MQRLDPDPATSFLARDRRATIRPGSSPFDVLWEVKRLLELVRFFLHIPRSNTLTSHFHWWTSTTG